MEISIDKIDYMILQTGYTSRIIEILCEHNILVKTGECIWKKIKTIEYELSDDFKGEEEYIHENMHEYLKDLPVNYDWYTDDFVKFLDSIVFCKDKDLFSVKAEDDILKDDEKFNLRSSIVLKCKWFGDLIKYVSILHELDYCNFLDLEDHLDDLIYFEKDGYKFLYASFATESG